ncbi:hypothetical protein VNO78_20574 [Psophocarpus tetragonolobus]|uniref:Uncharacterized protein n=1 Tax=Psophocarpus tetragonolobus TaxID=3891 RepID=A0AAN9SB71_PSOTE
MSGGMNGTIGPNFANYTKNNAEIGSHAYTRKRDVFWHRLTASSESNRVSWATRNNNSRTAKVENYWNTVYVSRSGKS